MKSPATNDPDPENRMGSGVFAYVRLVLRVIGKTFSSARMNLARSSCAVWLCLPALIMECAASEAILDQSQTTGGAVANLRSHPDRKTVLAQTFTPSISGRLVQVNFGSHEYCYVDEHPTTIAITDTISGVPGTNILGKFVVAHLPAGLEASFADQEVYLEAGTLYAIVISTTAAKYPYQLYTFAASDYNPYPGGMLWHCWEGVPWEPAPTYSDTTKDLVFATYMIPSTPAIRLISPVNGSLVTEGVPVGLEAVVSSSTVPPVLIEFHVSGESVGSVTTPPYRLAWTPARIGEATLAATLTTTSGVISTSDVVHVTVRARGPDNDDFENRAAVIGDYAVAQFSNSTASLQPGEMRLNPATIGRTLWWEWKPPRSAQAVAAVRSAAASNAVVSAFIGSAVDALWLAASGSGQCSFKANAGETYVICVDSVVEPITDGTLVVALNDVEISAPAADARFAAPAAIPISGLRTGNSRDLAEVRFFCNGGEIGRDTQAPYELVTEIDVSGYYTLHLESSDAFGLVTRSVPVNVVVHPANDDFINATEISGYVVAIETSNVAATREGGRKWPWTTGTGEPIWADNQGGHSIWYRWTAPETGSCTIGGNGDGFGLLLVVYSGETVDTIMPIAGNAMGFPDPVTFDVVGGKTYQISIDGFFGEEGPIRWSLRLRAKNDDFTARTQFGGSFYETVTSFRGATLERDEQIWVGATNAASLWWSWTAPVAGQVTVSARSPTGTLQVGVFTGTDLAGLKPAVEPSGWAHESVVRFHASEGATYQFAVFGSAEDTSNFTFSLVLEMLQLLDPQDGTVFRAPADLTMSASASESMGQLRRVVFIANDKPVGEVESPPYVYRWTNVQAATYTIRAEAVLEEGAVLKSAPVTVLVYSGTELPTPKIWAAPPGYASYAMNAAGAFYVFGDVVGQFGVATNADLFWPQLGMQPPDGDRWQMLAGFYGLTERGLLYRSGVELIPVPGDAHRWTKIVPCGFYVLALTDTGCIYELSWLEQLHFPAGDSGWIDVGGGTDFWVTLDSRGRAFFHQVGAYNKLQSHEIEMPSGVTAFKEIAAAMNGVVLLGNNQQLYEMARPFFHPWYGQFLPPRLVKLPEGVSCWQKFSVGGFHVLVIGDNGELYAWGRNYENQLGIGVGGDQPDPVQVPKPDGVTAWSDISAGYMHSLAIGNDGNLYAWGPNYKGELGIGHLPSQPMPARVSNVGSLCGYPVIYTTGENVVLPDGSFKVRFKSDLNRLYLIQYSDDMETWKTAQLPLNGTGNITEWIDDGPPKTEVHPALVAARFYRIVFGR